MFKNREEAGQRLAAALEKYRGSGAAVFALARGGVPVAREVAAALKLPLSVLAVRKIGHPVSPEYALGAVDDAGTVLLDESAATMAGTSRLQAETARQYAEAKRRAGLYAAGRRAPEIEGRTAILIDDGVATGLSMRLAVKTIKTKRPEKIVVAVPVSPPEALPALKQEGADEVVVLARPEEFAGAVGAHYVDFAQVADDEVLRIVRELQ